MAQASHAAHSRKTVTFETEIDPSILPSESRPAEKKGRPCKQQHKQTQVKARALEAGDMAFIKIFYRKISWTLMSMAPICLSSSQPLQGHVQCCEVDLAQSAQNL